MTDRRALATFAIATGAALTSWAPSARAQSTDVTAVLRLMGARAKNVFAPRGAPAIGGLVRVPPGVRAADLGLREIAPGFARIWGEPSRIVSFADAHPDLRVEVSPPLHLLLDKAARYVGAQIANASGYDGSNVLVGVADTGIDLTHPNFRDASGGTRVEWLLDLSTSPIGKHPDLEQQYGSTDANGVTKGAVWAKADIDALLASSDTSKLPQDEVGHGTLVASCAAGQDSSYQGVAPRAGLLVARITSDSGGEGGNDEMLRGVAFLFDRADALQRPIVVNISLGTDFGPHDGTLSWEEALASHVGSAYPGRALVVAAGNSGSIAETSVHQSVHISHGETLRVPVLTRGARQQGSVQIWIAMHPGADLKVGLDAPDGTWISPVGNNDAAGKNTSKFSAAIYNGSRASGGAIPSQTRGAIVVWEGIWPAGRYFVTLSGDGTADLYVQGTGDVSLQGDVGFAEGAREGTINLPATHPAIIGVGCTINKKSWPSLSGVGYLQIPLLDAAGGEPDPTGSTREPIDGEPCWFSSAGPTLTGVPKPEIMAPGAAIVGALSQQALPPAAKNSIFTTDCRAGSTGAAAQRCLQIDETHGVSAGTSFSAPLVAGAVALLLQHDRSLTQGDVVAALQGGAHPLRGSAPFNDQAGPGELDVMGALEAADRLRDPRLALPSRAESWMTLGADVYLADGSTPLQAIVELRGARMAGAGPTQADGFGDRRLAVYARVDGAAHEQTVRRVAPGVWVATVQLPAGLGGSGLTVGATFDGVDIVSPKTVPIATDLWNARYPPSVHGGCAIGPTRKVGGEGAVLAVAGISVGAVVRRRRRA
jgi:subtilisin family serine protease